MKLLSIRPRLAILLVVAWIPIASAAESDSEMWWQTECIVGNGLLHDAVAVFRNFGTPASATGGEERTLIFQDGGVQYELHGVRGNYRWKDVDKVVVEKVGTENPALSITVILDGKPVGGTPFGTIEYTCWRSMETLIDKYAPGKVEGSPKKPQWPLHDKQGREIPE